MLLVNSPVQTKPCLKIKRKKGKENLKQKEPHNAHEQVGKTEFKIPIVGCSEEFALSVG